MLVLMESPIRSKQMTYDIVYQLKGDSVPARHAHTTNTEAKAVAYCRQLNGPLANAIHYVITCDDGRTIHDTRKDGLIF